MQTLVAALRASPGAPASEPAAPGASHADDADEVQRLMLRRRDGSRVIALWRPVSVWDQSARQPIDPGSVPVELSFEGAAARDVAVWRPSVSAGAGAARARRARRLPLDLAGDLVLVSFR